MFDNMRRLYPRGPENRGLAVDADGAMLGPDCVLVRRTAQGYRCISRQEGAVLQEFLLGEAKQPDWLFEQCRRILQALADNQVALAQIAGLHLPIVDLDPAGLRQLSRAAPFIRANFNPDEPRIPAGQSNGGEWASDGPTFLTGLDGSAGPSGESDIRPASDGGDTVSHPYGIRNLESPHQADPNVIPAAYQGYYHDEVVDLLRQITVAGGGSAVTHVPLTAIDGTTAIADLIVNLPGHGTFLIEVKTGEHPRFTDAQRRVYPMLQIGGHVTSAKADIASVGLTPNKPLPPLRVLVYWAPAPGRPVIREWLPPPEFIQ